MIDCSCKRECVCVVSECVSGCIERGVGTGGAEGSSMELHGGWGNVNQLERFERFFIDLLRLRPFTFYSYISDC